MTSPTSDSDPLVGAQPLFLLGAPRSGTTFVAKMLNSHPQVLCTNEVRFLSFLNKAQREIPTGDAGGLHCARVHADAVVSTLIEHTRSLYDAIFTRIALDQGRGPLRYYGDKNPHHHENLELIANAFPDACYIHLRRNSRDVVCSILEMHAKMGLLPKPTSDAWELTTRDVRKQAAGVNRAMRREREFTENLPPDRVMRINYEDLLQDTLGWIERIFLEFLGLDSSSAPLAWYQEGGQHDSHGIHAGPVDFIKRSVGRAERKLGAKLIAVIDEEFSRQ